MLFLPTREFCGWSFASVVSAAILTSSLSASLINRSWKTLRHSFLQTRTIWVTVWNLHGGRGGISQDATERREG